MRGLRWRSVGGLLLAGLLAASGPALADGYKDGLDALEAGEWVAAERHFRAAIEDKPEARKRLFAKPYMPYYYLGVALAEQGRCEEALEAFTESEHQGLITEQAEEHADLERRRQACRQRIERRNEVDAALAAARQAVEAARAEAQSVASLRQAPDLARRWGQGSPSLARREAQAQSRLDEAVRVLEAFRRGQDDPGTLRQVTEAARQAREELASILADARSLRGEVRATREGLLDELDGAAEQARSALDASRDLAPYPPSITAQRREILRLLEQREALATSATLDEIESLRDRLRQAARTLRDESAGPPGELLAAAGALFSGRYGQVLELLEDRTFPNRRANAHAHLLRAAARYYLYEAGERQDETLLDAARKDAAVARRMDSGVTLPERAFPPGFRKLWDEVEEP